MGIFIPGIWMWKNADRGKLETYLGPIPKNRETSFLLDWPLGPMVR